MTRTISSSNIVMRPTARSVSAFEISPVQINAAAKEERAPSVGGILSQRMKIMRHAKPQPGRA